MKIKNSLSETINLCAFAPLRETNSYFHSPTPIDLAFIEQAYVEVSSAAVLKETGWSAALFRRLIATGASDM